MTQLRAGIVWLSPRIKGNASTFLFQVVPAGLYFTIVGVCGYALGGMILMLGDAIIHLA
jgi:hypothetical protein